MKAPVLESERLLLKPLSSDYLSDAYLAWMNDPNVNVYLETPVPYTAGQLQTFLENVDRSNILFWAIVDKATDKHIGNLKIDPVNKRHGFAEYGILLGDKMYHGKGYAREASELAIRYCFDELQLRKITLGVVAQNIAAVKLYEKMGFVTEGTYREHGYYNNQWCDVLRMALFNPGRQR
jgi:[ribosomal protein S5]-alanine N-acetyltransferase